MDFASLNLNNKLYFIQYYAHKKKKNLCKGGDKKRKVRKQISLVLHNLFLKGGRGHPVKAG
jgi:hypothetical protein